MYHVSIHLHLLLWPLFSTGKLHAAGKGEAKRGSLAGRRAGRLAHWFTDSLNLKLLTSTGADASFNKTHPSVCRFLPSFSVPSLMPFAYAIAQTFTLLNNTLGPTVQRQHAKDRTARTDDDAKSAAVLIWKTQQTISSRKRAQQPLLFF